MQHWRSITGRCKVRWMDPATRHLTFTAQSIRNWWRLREVLSISRPSLGGGVRPPGGSSLLYLIPGAQLGPKHGQDSGAGREECHKHQPAIAIRLTLSAPISDYRDIIEPSPEPSHSPSDQGSINLHWLNPFIRPHDPPRRSLVH